jgi:hypothetical protein
MTHSVGWEITTESLIEGGTEGRDALLKTLAELEAAGYLARQQVREGGKFKGVDYIITEPAGLPAATPSPENPVTAAPSPCPEKPDTAKPTPVNPHQRTTSFLEDHPEEEHSVTADAVTGGERAPVQAVLIDAPAPIPITTAPSKASEEARLNEAAQYVAKTLNERHPALGYLKMMSMAKRMMKAYRLPPNVIGKAMDEIYTGGGALVDQKVGQVLEGIVTASGRRHGGQDKDEMIYGTLNGRLSDSAGTITGTPFEPQLRITS